MPYLVRAEVAKPASGSFQAEAKTIRIAVPFESVQI